MAKITAGGLAVAAAQTTVGNLRALAEIMLLPVIATAVAMTALGLVIGAGAEQTGGYLLATNLIALLIEAPAMAAWARVCCGHDAPADRRYRFGPNEARFLRYSLLFTAIAAVLASVMAVSAANGHQAGAFLALGGALGFLIILPRLMLALPAAALGREDLKIGDMLKRSEGRTATLAFAFLLVLPPLLAVLLVGGQLGAAGAAMFSGHAAILLWTSLWLTLSRYVLQAVLMAVTARAYGELTSPKGSASP